MITNIKLFKESLNFEELFDKVTPSFVDDKYVQNTIDGKIVDLYSVAPLDVREDLLKNYLNFSDEKMKNFSEDEKASFFNSNIYSYKNKKMFTPGKKPTSKKMSLKQWAKQQGRNLNEIGIEKDYNGDSHIRKNRK